MIKYLLCTAFISLTYPTLCQNSIVAELDSIHDETQATKFIEIHKTNNVQLFVFNKEKHKTQLAKELFSIVKGGKKIIATDIEKTHYKVIDKYEIPYHRYSYVYLDARDKSNNEIKQLKNNIISKYNEGFRFKDLAKIYSMDINAKRGGDMGWFTRSNSTTALEDAIMNENNGQDIFTLDFPETQAIYIVVRTHPTKFIEEIKVLKVTEKI